MFRSLSTIADTTKAQMQIQGAFQRADTARYRVRWARGEQARAAGFMFWRVPSSRPDEYPCGHVVSVQHGRWHCDCEACVYERSILCIHVATVLLRLERARRAGTRKMARMGRALVGV